MEIKRSEKERRRDIRVGMPRPFVIKFQIKKHKGFFPLRPKKLAAVQNMSAGGVFLEFLVLEQKEAERIMAGKDQLILEMKTPESKRPIRIKGKVIRLEKTGKYGKPTYVAGLCFEDIQEKDREEILHQLINTCFQSGCRLDS